MLISLATEISAQEKRDTIIKSKKLSTNSIILILNWKYQNELIYFSSLKNTFNTYIVE